MEDMPVVNTDRELWRKSPGDYYSPSVFVTENGSIGINVGGHVLVAYVEAWFNAGKVAWCVEPPNNASTRPPIGVGMRRRFGKFLVELGSRLIQHGGG